MSLFSRIREYFAPEEPLEIEELPIVEEEPESFAAKPDKPEKKAVFIPLVVRDPVKEIVNEPQS